MTGTAEHRSTITGKTRVRLHALRTRADRESWVVGRVETGQFITIPQVGYRAMTLLGAGSSVDAVHRQLKRETGGEVDVASFVRSLVELGFVSELNAQRVSQPPVPAPTFPWLRPRHVRWLLSPAIAWMTGSTVLVAVVVMLVDPALAPRYRDLLWSGSGGAVVLGNAAIGWTLLFLHELAHLATARAAGVPGRMSLGTRLQFLVAQTDVSGIWAAPRRVRVTVYLAGIALNLLVFSGCLLVRSTVATSGPAHDLVAAAGLISITFVPFQFLVFMRTDLYFLLQDLTGSANLYKDGSMYTRHLAKRLWRGLRRNGDPSPDPSRRLPARERVAVRSYAVLLVLGTAACLAVAATITIPVSATLLARAAGKLAGSGAAAEVFDAMAVLATSTLVIGLWIRGWWRRHRHQVRQLPGRVPRRTGGR